MKTLKNGGIWQAPEGYVEKKFNYLYKLTLIPDPRYYYYGVHCSNKKPEEDNYGGSGASLRIYREKYGKDCFKRDIVKFFGTKAEALQEEQNLVTYELLQDPFCLNRLVGGGCFDGTGKIRVTNGLDEQIIDPKDFSRFEELGYRRGSADFVRKKIGDTKIGRIAVVSGSCQKFIYPEELPEYEQRGFTLGRASWIVKKIVEKSKGIPKSEDLKEKISQAHKGLRWIHSGSINKAVQEEELNRFLSEGFVLGFSEESSQKKRVANIGKHHSLETKKKLRERNLGKLRIYNSNSPENFLFIFPEDLDRYLQQGWLRGSPKKGTGIYLNNGKIQRKFPLEEIEARLSEGWTKGFLKGVTAGKRRVVKNGVGKIIDPSELQKYLKEGWKVGTSKGK